MKLQFFKGMSREDRLHAFERVISGELLLHAIVGAGTIVILRR